MTRFRNWVPLLGFLALIALFLKLPEISLFKCKTCSASSPYLPLIGAGYFSALTAASLLFPAFPSRLIARAGFTWAVLLAIALTYIDFPHMCAICLFCHGLHIAIWTIWAVAPSNEITSNVRERLCLTLFAPVATVALFSCLNLTFLAYGIKINPPMATTFKPGDVIPTFTAETASGRSITYNGEGMLLNFVAPGCPFCKEQLSILKEVSDKIINISPALTSDLVSCAPAAEWVQDKNNTLRKLFKVAGYPTLFIIGPDGKVSKIIPGVPDTLRSSLSEPTL